MTDRTAAFGTGLLSRAAAIVYTHLVLVGLLLVTVAPGLVVLTLLDRDASNVPLAAVCAVPVGPALSAVLYALRRVRPDLADLRPAAAFWRGYRLNAAGVLRLWLPWLVAMTVLATVLAHPAAAGVPGWWRVLLVVLAVVATLWMANALLIVSFFAFRSIDVARLAAYFLIRTFRVTVAELCLLVVAAGVVLVATEAALVLTASLFAVLLLRAGDPLRRLTEEEFTA